MITKTRTRKSDLADLFGLVSLKSSGINKQILISMAKNGESKPSPKIKLGKSLKNYISKSSAAYDPVFSKYIKKLRPNWFLVKNNSAKNKLELIKRAKDGKDKPNSKKTKMGMMLRNYTRKNSSTYDSIFAETIKKLRPDWFIFKLEIANQKKQLLIKMAKNKEPKPSQKTKLGAALRNYTIKSSNSYNFAFTKLLKSLSPDWFIPYACRKNKNRLLI